MKSIRNAMRFLVMAAMAGVLFTPRAEATSISVSPHFQNVNVGDPVTVDILVSDYSPSVVGGASFFFTYDSTLLTSTSFLLDPDLKMSNALNPILDFGSGFIGAGGTSPFEAFFVAGVDTATLATLQDGNPFRLATLTFRATNPGFSNLVLSFEPVFGTFLSDGPGNDLPALAVNGCISVSANVPSVSADAVDPCPNASAVPEPATFGLLATGLAALVRRRRKAQK